jgi:DNA-binding LacI/PurR family transcriptional regulator
MATIKDVAQRAGVSPSTVSYVLSGKRSISPAVRQRVLAVMEELQFTPSALGRSLRTGRSGLIGMIFPLVEPRTDWLLMEFVGMAAHVANAAGYGLGFFTSQSTPEEVLDLLRNHTVDGLILTQVQRHDQRVAILRDADYPFALVGRNDDTSGLSYVDFDYEQACYRLFEHLATLGHRHIGCIDMRRDQHAHDLGYAWYLRRGYERALATLPIQIERVETSGSVAGDQRATMALLERHPTITAMVDLVETTALGVVRGLYDAGRRVPDDCALACISTHTLTAWSTPPLTSVDVPLAELGRIGAELVLRQLDGDARGEQLILPASLQVRASTAPPPATP